MNSKKLNLKDSIKVSIVYRYGTPEALTLAKSLAKWLKLRGYSVATAPDQKAIPGTKTMKSLKELGKSGLIVVLGGDGTYLRAVRMLKGQSTPILGINLGSLGFLTPTRSDEVFTIVEQTLQGKMELQPRAMLEVALIRKKKVKAKALALNDVVMERGSLSQLINIEVRVADEFVLPLKGDGVIVSSPTGSTAYNLAAGGPIVYPETKAIVVTPICSHSLTTRPTIFPDDTNLSFKLTRKVLKDPSKQNAHLVVDGQLVSELLPDDEVRITRSASDHYLVKDPNHDHFSLVREKLKFGNRD